MFTTHRSSAIPTKNQLGEVSYWTNVHMELNSEWFFCDYNYSVDGAKVASNVFLTQFDQLLELKQRDGVIINAVYLVSPNYLNGSNGWKMDKLRKIELCVIRSNDKNEPLTKYLLTDGSEVINTFGRTFAWEDGNIVFKRELDL